MNKFENLYNALIEEKEAKEAEARHYVQHGYLITWAEQNRVESDNGLEHWSTANKWDAYKAGRITREKAVEYATARALRDIEKTFAAKVEKLDRVAAAPDLDYAEVSVEWKRSSYWGSCPTAKATVNGWNSYSQRAGGCGYDKLSAAVGGALSASPSVLKALYQAAEDALAAGKCFAYLNSNCVTWRDVLGYGSGYSVLPYLEGGVGVSCYETIFANCGYKFRRVASGKTFDVFTIERGA